MTAITLRNLPPEVQRRIRKRARERGISANRAVIGLLEEHLCLEQPAKNRRYHDLDHLFGAWTREQYDEFSRMLAEQRGIDPDMWR